VGFLGGYYFLFLGGGGVGGFANHPKTHPPKILNPNFEPPTSTNKKNPPPQATTTTHTPPNHPEKNHFVITVLFYNDVSSIYRAILCDATDCSIKL